MPRVERNNAARWLDVEVFTPHSRHASALVDLFGERVYMATKKTIARGAVISRAYIYKWIAREKKEVDRSGLAEPRWKEGYQSALIQLSAWLKAQPKRTARKGGIGRQ